MTYTNWVGSENCPLPSNIEERILKDYDKVYEIKENINPFNRKSYFIVTGRMKNGILQEKAYYRS